MTALHQGKVFKALFSIYLWEVNMAKHADLLATLAEARVLYLTTQGYKSGQPRTIEIWFVVHDGKLYLNAERGQDARWVRNIQHDPGVQVQVQTYQGQGRARVLERPHDDALWQVVANLSRQKYGWGEGVPVEVCLDVLQPAVE